jgi:hypothetical protein
VAEMLANGGVYCDNKIVPTRPFDSFLPEMGGWFPYDIGSHGIWNGFMAFPPGDPLMAKALDLIYDNVARRYYGTSTLDPTGPNLVMRAYYAVLNEAGYDAYLHNAILDSEGVLIVQLDRLPAETAPTGSAAKGEARKAKYDPHPFVIVHNAEYRRIFTNSNLCHYTRLWDERAIYYEARCDPKLGLPWNTRLGMWNTTVKTVVFTAAAMCLVTLIGLTLFIVIVRRRKRAKDSLELSG